MAASKSKSKKNQNSLLSLLIVLAFVLAGVLFKSGSDKNELIDKSVVVSTNEVVVHTIDVGQGSSTLIQCGTDGILIDAGEAEYGTSVTEYIKKVGVKKLSYCVASHPHSDHIGGMRKVLNSIEVEHVIMPYIIDKYTPTTAIYERLLDTIDEKKIDCIFWEYGDDDTFSIENVKMQILAPVNQSKELNNMSLICRVQAFNTVFMVMGDAENAELKDLDETGVNVRCNVMIMAHHGSLTSLYTPLLDRSGFTTAVISCGKGNSYGHPHREILSYLDSKDIEILRTDVKGNIKFTCTSVGFSAE